MVNQINADSGIRRRSQTLRDLVKDGLFGCLAKLRRGLFIAGFAATDASVFPPDDVDWVNPADPLALLDCPRLQKKI
jgi:hypothetical protein